MRTGEVLEPRRALHIMRRSQPLVTAGTFRQIGARGHRLGHLLADDAEERERGARRQARAFLLVEPERLTRMAEIDDDTQLIHPFHRLLPRFAQPTRPDAHLRAVSEEVTPAMGHAGHAQTKVEEDVEQLQIRL